MIESKTCSNQEAATRTPAHVWKALKVAQSSTIPMLCFEERKRCRVTCANTGARVTYPYAYIVLICESTRTRAHVKIDIYCTEQRVIVHVKRKCAQCFDRMGLECECERRARDRRHETEREKECVDL